MGMDHRAKSATVVLRSSLRSPPSEVGGKSANGDGGRPSRGIAHYRELEISRCTFAIEGITPSAEASCPRSETDIVVIVIFSLSTIVKAISPETKAARPGRAPRSRNHSVYRRSRRRSDRTRAGIRRERTPGVRQVVEVERGGSIM
jgi:hypothetical protein